MKNRWWMFLLTGVLVLSALFIGCEETDDDDDDSTPSEIEGLVGEWVLFSGTVDGSAVYYSSVVEFEEDGDGVNYIYMYEDDGVYEEWNFAWDDVDGELEIDPDNDDDPFMVEVDFSGDDVVTFEYTDEGTRVETYYRITSNRDSDLYGVWNLQSLVEDGETVPNSRGTVNFTNGGDFYLNLSIGGEAVTDTMEWSTINDYIVMVGREGNIEGQVVNYDIDGTSMTVTAHLGASVQVTTFEKYEVGEIDEDLVGRWMTYKAESGGSYVDFRETVIFNDDGTGVSYHTEDPGELEVESVSFLWSVVEGVLIVDTDQDDPMEIDYEVTENQLVIDFEMDGSPLTETMIKWTGDIENQLVGQWILESETLDGQPTEVGYVLVTLNDNGTGSYDTNDGSDNFTWCVNDGKILIPVVDFAGYVGEYTVSDEQFTMTEYYSFGVVVGTYVPFTPGEDLDPDLFGTWIGSTRYVDGSILDGYSIITLQPNGTGTFAFELEWPDGWDEYDIDVTWTAEDGVLNMYEGTTLIHEVSYTVSGDVVETEYTDEAERFFEQSFHKWTEETPSGFIGTWILEETTMDGEQGDFDMNMATTMTLNEGGSLSVRYVEWSDALEEEEIIEMEGEWCVADDYFLVMFEEEIDNYFSCEAMQYTVPMERQTDFSDPRDEGDYIYTYRKFEGTNDPNLVGTWVMYQYTLQATGMGDLVDSEQNQTIIANADGTGTTLSDWDTGSDDEWLNDINEADVIDFEWLASDGYLLVIDETGRGSSMPYTLNGDFLEMTTTEIEGESSFTFIMEWVKKLDEYDAAVVGNWEMTGLEVNGTPETFEEDVSFTLNGDGSGTYVEDGDTDSFTWSSSNSYMIIHIEDMETPDDLYEGIYYEVQTGELRVTTYYIDYSGEAATVEYVQIFTPQAR